MKKYAIQIVFFCIVFSFLAGCGTKSPKKHRRPIVETVKRVDLKDVISNTGNLRSVVNIDLQSEASGRIDTILVNEGAKLKKGDVILKIDPERLKTRMEKLNLGLRKARIKQNAEKRKYENALKLSKYGKFSGNELDDLKDRYELAGIDLKEIKLELRDIKKELENTIIRSPMDGVLVDLFVEKGEIVVSATGGLSAGTRIGRIADISRLEIETEIGEIDYPKVKQGMPVDISMALDPSRTTTGKVSFLSLSAKKQSNSVVSNFKIRITVDSLLEGMVPGVNVNVDLVLVEKKDVLGVPYSMVKQKKTDDKIVYTVMMADEKKPRRIKVGITDYKYYEVLQGLKEGDKVMRVPVKPDKFIRRH